MFMPVKSLFCCKGLSKIADKFIFDQREIMPHVFLLVVTVVCCFDVKVRTYLKACVTSVSSSQPAVLCSLVSVFSVPMNHL